MLISGVLGAFFLIAPLKKVIRDYNVYGNVVRSTTWLWPVNAGSECVIVLFFYLPVAKSVRV